MRIVCLIENTPGAEGCAFEHGLSFYIETGHHRLLMDTGASEASLANAARLGVDLRTVDTVVLSHGHYDHTGGVIAFAGLNPDAEIYLQRSASAGFYHDERYIGIDPRILSLPQLRLIEGGCRIDDELTIFSGITGRRLWPRSNLLLSRALPDGSRCGDDFAHEQCLVISEGGKRVLLSGCAHNGILNVLDRCREIFPEAPDAVFSGFHMMKKTDYTEAETETILAIAAELKQTPSIYYTGHCTGGPAFDLLRSVMGDRLRPIHTGLEWTI